MMGAISVLPGRPIATDPIVDAALARNAPVAIGVSGGKDSQAAAIATIAHLDRIGHSGPRLLVHADLGIVEWKDSFPVCERLAKQLGVELLVVRRAAGDLMDRWEARCTSLSTVTLVPCWSTPKMRFCTSEMKTHVIRAALKRRFGSVPLVNVTGVRRQESSARATCTIAQTDASSSHIAWRPIADWVVEDVFSTIEATGLEPHPAYGQFGMARVSCRFCIMSSIADLTAASRQDESHDLLRRMVTLECESGFAFQGARWLGDVAPAVLGAELRRRLLEAKARARQRAAIEARITKDMLYVKGWPTRMLSDDEADTLSLVRGQITALYRFDARIISRTEIQARYAELIALRDAKAVAA
ncbi:phosphoadenosine phosphosulfate reductase domain-containing protein [Shinella sp.]|uniref:phosphoadenosine phosphosulfate reductase domain-containing protein n=1 Tax=Shinella sp. TaxID=1870904 RepID=UPI003F6F4996